MDRAHPPRHLPLALLAPSALVLLAGAALTFWPPAGDAPEADPPAPPYLPRKPLETSGFSAVSSRLSWPPDATLAEIAGRWRGAGRRGIAAVDRELGRTPPAPKEVVLRLVKAVLFNYEGRPERAAEALGLLRATVEADEDLAREWLYTVIYYQGVTGLRRGETDNCVLCRREGACVLPLLASAAHADPAGSRLAVLHFTEYLRRFPDDLEVRWLLNVAHMTLAEYPAGVDARYLVDLAPFSAGGAGMGRFREAALDAGLDRLNWAGGAVMEDFDGDGLLDLAVTSSDPTQPMALYRNRGDGTFEDRTAAAGLSGQLGGLYCVQADYDNDGRPDLFVARGGWLKTPMRPSLLRNNGDGTFSDVTEKAGLLHAANAGCAAWADFDGDGLLDLFVGGEGHPNRLYRNRGDGTFEEVAARAGVGGGGPGVLCKGCAWFDFDGDGRPDLFLNNFGGPSRLLRNNGDGTFTDATASAGIRGPDRGFSCWAFDFDNDGWPDLFATSYDRTLADVVKGLTGEPQAAGRCRLYRNKGGKGFEDVTEAAGLAGCYAAMGSNFADFDGDGWPDLYLATGDPELSTLVPNRMFRNVGGERFEDVTASSRTGHLQKGHGVACGDWRRRGLLDLFVESGGTVPGDRYRNLLFLNPGHGNDWLTVKLVGKRTNRSAIGARVKVVTSGRRPLTVYRHVGSGSSFGANPLQQTIGLGRSGGAVRLEVYWPASGTTQSFGGVPVNRAIEVTEFEGAYRTLDWGPVPTPAGAPPAAG